MDEPPPMERMCSVCLEAITKAGDGMGLPCMCVFHKICIEDWLKKNFSCPNCRRAPNEFKVGFVGEPKPAPPPQSPQPLRRNPLFSRPIAPLPRIQPAAPPPRKPQPPGSFFGPRDFSVRPQCREMVIRKDGSTARCRHYAMQPGAHCPHHNPDRPNPQDRFDQKRNLEVRKQQLRLQKTLDAQRRRYEKKCREADLRRKARQAAQVLPPQPPKPNPVIDLTK